MYTAVCKFLDQTVFVKTISKTTTLNDLLAEIGTMGNYAPLTATKGRLENDRIVDGDERFKSESTVTVIMPAPGTPYNPEVVELLKFSGVCKY